MRLQGTSLFSAIECNEGAEVPSQIQILRTGKFNHPSYGFFEISSKVLSEMKENFDKKVRGIDLALDYFHESDREASGWITGLELKEAGQSLWANVRWTPAAAKKLAERELRYFSPDFTFEWTDPETSQKFNNVLFGGGLTNRPFVKDMQAIVANEKKQNQGDQKVDKIKELEDKNLKLSDDMKKMEDMSANKDVAIADLQKQIDELKTMISNEIVAKEKAMKEKVALEEKVALSEKEAGFNKLLSEGKAVVAQKEAYLKGDMNKFIELSQPLNMKASGTGADSKEESGDDEDKVMKLAEEIKKTEGISLPAAISKALKLTNKGGN